MGFGCFLRSLFQRSSKKEKRHLDARRYPDQTPTNKESDDEKKKQTQTQSSTMKLNQITNTLPHSTIYQVEDETRGMSKQPSNVTHNAVPCKITIFKNQKPPEVKHKSRKNQPLFNDKKSDLIFEKPEKQFVRRISEQELIEMQSSKLQSSDTVKTRSLNDLHFKKQRTYLSEEASSSFQVNKVPETSKAFQVNRAGNEDHPIYTEKCLSKQQQLLDPPCHSGPVNEKMVQNLRVNKRNAQVSNAQLSNNQAQSSTKDDILKCQKIEQELTLQRRPPNCGAEITESTRFQIQGQATVNEDNKNERTIRKTSPVNPSNQLNHPKPAPVGHQQQPNKLCGRFDCSTQELQPNQLEKPYTRRVECQKPEQELTSQRRPPNCEAEVTESSRFQIQEQAAVNENHKNYEQQRKVEHLYTETSDSDEQPKTGRTIRNTFRVNPSNQLYYPKLVQLGKQQQLNKSCRSLDSLTQEFQLSQLTKPCIRRVEFQEPQQDLPAQRQPSNCGAELTESAEFQIQEEVAVNEDNRAYLHPVECQKPEQELTMQRQPSNCGAEVTDSTGFQIQEEVAVNDGNKAYLHGVECQKPELALQRRPPNCGPEVTESTRFQTRGQAAVNENNKNYEQQRKVAQLYTKTLDSDEQPRRTIRNTFRVNPSNQLYYPKLVQLVYRSLDSLTQELQLNQLKKPYICREEFQKPQQIHEEAAINEDNKNYEHQCKGAQNNQYLDQLLYTESSDEDKQVYMEGTIRNASRENLSNQLDYPKPVLAGQQQQPNKLCERFDSSPQELQLDQLTNSYIRRVEYQKPEHELTLQRRPWNCGAEVTESTGFQIQEQALVNEDNKNYEQEQKGALNNQHFDQQLYTESSDEQPKTGRTIRNTSRENLSNQLDYPKPVIVIQQQQPNKLSEGCDSSPQELQLDELTNSYIRRVEYQKLEQEVAESTGYHIQHQAAVNEGNINYKQHKVPPNNQYPYQQLYSEALDLDEQNLGANENEATVPETAIEIWEDCEEAMELKTGDSDLPVYDVQPRINEYLRNQTEIEQLCYFCGTFLPRINEFVGTTQSDEYYFINESLTRAVLKLDRLNVENNVQQRLLRKRVIKYIYDLFDALEKKVSRPQ